jgi:glycolate oxidase iron-sulfur subunit
VRRGTLFTPELLDRCISCGFCLPACPTYALTGDETSSPRGRINLMRAVEEGRLPLDDPTVQEEASFCLGCRACEPVCPAGVEYGALLEEWRDHAWTGSRKGLRLRLLLWFTSRTWRVRLMGWLRRPAGHRDGTGPSLMLGCFERALFPKVSKAGVALIPDVHVPGHQGCCGALHAHNGDLARGRQLADELGRDLPGTILTTSGGCAAHLASVLGEDRVQELSEWLAQAPPLAHRTNRRIRVAIQDSCHLRNGKKVWRQPRELLAQIPGLDLVELPSAAGCCGAAGTYSILRPRDSERVLAPKLAEIEEADLDYIVAVNPGCLRQLQVGLRRHGLRTQAIHLAELLFDTSEWR